MTAKKDMKGIVVTIDRVDGTSAGQSVTRYNEIVSVLDEHFEGLRIRVGCKPETLRSAPSVKRATARSQT